MDEHEKNSPPACGCQHRPVDSARAMPLVTESTREPIVALADPGGVYECGPGGCSSSAERGFVAPSQIEFTRLRAAAGGGIEEVGTSSHELPQALREAWETDGPVHGKRACLPWVRVTRDPASFQSCLSMARAVGPIKTPSKAYRFLRDWFAEQDQETFLVVMLDVQLQVRGVGPIARGARDSTPSPVADVLRLPLIEGASAILVAHNHPTGKVDPSRADKELTKSLVSACETVGIRLFDHLIVGHDSYYSFYDHGLYIRA